MAHKVGLKMLRNCKEIPTENLNKMAEFVLKNNYFEFISSVFKQISSTAIWTKIYSQYACIFMNQHVLFV